MSKNLSPKCKQCRRIGEKLFLKSERCSSPKCAMVRRNYPPGLHGPKGRPRQSGYSIQLQEKQKAKKEYNLLEKQFRLTFEKAKKHKGDAGENLLKLLEMRFDNTIYRLGFGKSRSQARQLVNHGHFTINGEKVNIPSYQIKTGDIIKIKKSHRNLKPFNNLQESLKSIKAPSWLNLDIKEVYGKVLHQPTAKDIETIRINTQIIVEYYSR